MTTPMDHLYNDSVPSESSFEAVPQRKKLQLKPRSRQRQHSRTSGSGLFGDARPREEILQQRGLDPTVVDRQYERKAAPVHYTAAQEERLETARAELEAATAAWRDANENEMPEEEFRIAEDVKRKELNALMEEFAKANLTEDAPESSKTYVSSSGRRHSGARDVNRGRYNDGGGDKHSDSRSSGRYVKEEKKEWDHAFDSFSTSRRRHNSTSEG